MAPARCASMPPAASTAARKAPASSCIRNAPGTAMSTAPNPRFGGTMGNKVVTTLARAFADTGHAVFRFNFRGVGATEGAHDEGHGETDDMLAVIEHARSAAGALPLKLAGFSFGGAVA